MSKELGMYPLIERVLSRREILKAQPSLAPKLAPREMPHRHDAFHEPTIKSDFQPSGPIGPRLPVLSCRGVQDNKSCACPLRSATL